MHAMRDTQEPHVASVTLTTIERAMELAEVRKFTKDALDLNNKFMCFQLVVVMPPVLVICNVRILLDSAPALLVIRVQNVTLLVVVILLVQAALHVIRLQVNVLATLVTQEPLATLVTPTTIKQVLEQLVQVSIANVSPHLVTLLWLLLLGRLDCGIYW